MLNRGDRIRHSYTALLRAEIALSSQFLFRCLQCFELYGQVFPGLALFLFEQKVKTALRSFRLTLLRCRST